MSLETATFIDQLDATNPTTTDTKSQGDDHFRLLKTVLKNSVKRVTRAFYVPGTVAKSANYTVLAADDNMTIICDPAAAAFTLTLPTLAAADAGWFIDVLKNTTGPNPVFITPPSGTINGFTKIRRSIEFVKTRITWTGSVFYATRPNGVPIGTVLEFNGTTLPNGHLWPNGGTFIAADYVELNTVMGGNATQDHRGRVVAGKDDMGGTSANRLTGLTDGVNGDTLGGTGGLESTTIVTANLPAYTPAGTNNAPTITSKMRGMDAATGPVNTNVDATSATVGDLTTTVSTASAPTFTGVAQGGTSAPGNNVQPTIIANKILVAE